ncbi:hypothetical protein PanWU01x14_001330 [Parasponia andersonii]|uniref:Ribosomal protein n=1 Tax=Parasponia andersonii TaxID=3476 RepID=A0A2P5E4U5_PARAD|nr:hypothetical protein PanWU01x14_001330 [Parasponia andersonii]
MHSRKIIVGKFKLFKTLNKHSLIASLHTNKRCGTICVKGKIILYPRVRLAPDSKQSVVRHNRAGFKIIIKVWVYLKRNHSGLYKGSVKPIILIR